MKNEKTSNTDTRAQKTVSTLKLRNKLGLFYASSIIGLAVGSECAPLPSLLLQGVQPATSNSSKPNVSNAPVEILPVRQVATFPVNTFLESIVIALNGTLFITSNQDGKIFRINPDGTRVVHATVAGKPVGLVFDRDGSLLVSALDNNKKSTIFRVSSDGTVEKLITIPDAVFPNGLTHFADDRYLMADSYRGAIWELDISQKSARIWIEHPLLARITPQSRLPAVNGLKFFKGVLYASNLDKAHIVRIPISQNSKPDEPQIFVQKVPVDDFAFDIEGNLYGATHLTNRVVRIAPNGNITTIAQAEQGVTGCTAVAFGRRKGDYTGLYVVGDGGIAAPPPTGVVPAEVVRIEVGKVGLRI